LTAPFSLSLVPKEEEEEDPDTFDDGGSDHDLFVTPKNRGTKSSK
jgi:hypothetical protein